MLWSAQLHTSTDVEQNQRHLVASPKISMGLHVGEHTVRHIPLFNDVLESENLRKHGRRPD